MMRVVGVVAGLALAGSAWAQEEVRIGSVAGVKGDTVRETFSLTATLRAQVFTGGEPTAEMSVEMSQERIVDVTVLRDVAHKKGPKMLIEVVRQREQTIGTGAATPGPLEGMSFIVEPRSGKIKAKGGKLTPEIEKEVRGIMDDDRFEGDADLAGLGERVNTGLSIDIPLPMDAMGMTGTATATVVDIADSDQRPRVVMDVAFSIDGTPPGSLGDDAEGSMTMDAAGPMQIDATSGWMLGMSLNGDFTMDMTMQQSGSQMRMQMTGPMTISVARSYKSASGAFSFQL